MTHPPTKTSVAIACGGTGGHLFPGMAVAEQLQRHDCDVTLLISPKEVDQQAVKAAQGMRVVTLPAVALQAGARFAFFRGFAKSYRASKRLFHDAPPAAVLGMGGFTSAPPLLAARRCGAAIFLHESNAIPGRANRWLSWITNHAFVGFPSAQNRLRCRHKTVTGTPVRSEFTIRAAAPARLELGLHPDRPTILVVGGSQGASGLNAAVAGALPLFAKCRADTQWIHLTGARDCEMVRAAYAAVRLPAIVLPFFDAMDQALAAASVAICRAGASCLAELAAMRTPAVLVPFPAAADNHQWHSAREFEQTGAARLLEQRLASPEMLSQMVGEFLDNPSVCARARAALEGWHKPRAATEIVELVLQTVAKRRQGAGTAMPATPASASTRHSSVLA